MPAGNISADPAVTDLLKNGAVVGVTDRVYSTATSPFTIEEILVRGDLTGELQYNGSVIRIEAIRDVIGLLVDERGARGPVWKGVTCEVVRRSQ